MMNLKNHKTTGLTFIEAILSLLIFSMLITSSIVLQSSLFSSVIRYSQRLHHMLFLSSTLTQYLNTPEKEQKKEYTIEPNVKITINKKKPSAKSLLKKYPNIFSIDVKTTWDGLVGKQEEHLIRFVFKKEETKKP